jgi:hypothetical protein
LDNGSSSRSSKFDDVVFMVVFNSPVWNVLPFLADLYTPYTSRLVFCSKHHPPAELPPGTGFLQVENMGGVMNGDNDQYECLRQALLDNRFLSSRIKGFAVAADDALIDWGHLADHDLQNLGMYISDPWKHDFSLERPDEDCGKLSDPGGGCKQWAHLIPYGYRAAQATYNELQKMLANGDSWAGPYVKAMDAFQKKFTWNHCDFFYLPAQLRGSYVQLSSVFAKHKVYFELAVPTMFALLSQVHNAKIADISGFVVDENINYTLSNKGRSLWRGDRLEFWKNQDKFVESGAAWWHPVKLSLLARHPEARIAFCKTTAQCRGAPTCN